MISLVGRFSSVGAVVGVRAPASVAAAAIAGLWVVGWLARSANYWRRIMAYARTGA